MRFLAYVPIPSGAKTATITAVDPGVVIDRVGVRLTRQASGSGERIIPQGANVAPNGDRLDVTSKCLRLNGRALIPVMGEMHYSRVPRDEWAKSLATMKAGGVSIVSTYVFWNHHEWKEGSISGLLLPGGIKVKKLSWQGDSYELELFHPDGRVTVQRK